MQDWPDERSQRERLTDWLVLVSPRGVLAALSTGLAGLVIGVLVLALVVALVL